MSAKLGHRLGRHLLTFVIIPASFLYLQPASAGYVEDHSYLPPWMIQDGNTTTKPDEAAGNQLQPAKVETVATRASKPNLIDPAGAAKRVGTRVVSYISGLFTRTARFATGN